jgi:hypothetical protein
MTTEERDSRQPATSLTIGAGLNLGGTYWVLKSEIVRGKEGVEWAFTATPPEGQEPNILAALTALCQEFDAGKAPFEKGMLPTANLKSLTFSSGNASYFKANAKIDIYKPQPKSEKGTTDPWFKLIVAFAKLGHGYFAGIHSDGQIELAKSGDGVVGQLLGDVLLDQIGLYYASADINVDPFVTKESAEPHFPRGLSVACRFGLPNSSIDVALNSSSGLMFSSTGDKRSRTGGKAQGLLTATQSASPPPRAGALGSQDSATKAALPDGRYWLKLDKTLGPLQLRRIGGEWKDNKLGLLLDATIELAGLTVALAGLMVRVPPSKLTKLQFTDVEFGLDGMELDFQRQPISISGALLKTTTSTGQVMYSGMASIRAATFSIGAIGSYGTTPEGKASFFIFGAYAGILGGPPCFVLEGIAAGFGYNRAITLPAIDQVRDFPLVSLVLGKSPRTSTTSPKSNMLDMLAGDAFPPVTGQYWIAAGVKFSSFKLIDAFALATVQFGARLEIALLGVATLQQPPKPAKPFIVVEIALKVRFAPDDGLLSVEARLTANSYLFDPSCRLTGGFAFYVWFKPTNSLIKDRSGDFVFTLGGYHPKFLVPDHYPTVPRVGFNWQLPEFGVSIKGEAYFALTPSFVMAGFRLSAVFSQGGFRAWFEIYADFVMGWEPFHYAGEVGARIGASYTFRVGEITVTLSFELAAQLTLWGPPFAGEAFVDLGIVAFTVPIGDRRAPKMAEPLEWTQFADKFLPVVEREGKREHAPLETTIVSGLVYEHRATNRDFTVVRPSELCLSVESLVPVKALDESLVPVMALDKPELPDRSWESTPLGIRPMQLSEFKSTLKMELVHYPSTGDSSTVLEKFGRQAIIKGMPEALWSPQPIPSTKQTAIQSNVIQNCLMGVRIKPKEPEINLEVVVTVTFRPNVWVCPLKKAPEKKPPKNWEHAVGDPSTPLRSLLSRADVSTFAGGISNTGAISAGLVGIGTVQDARKATVGAIVDAMSQLGFDIDSSLADSERYLVHSDTLVNRPWIIPIGKLIPQEHGQ